MRLNALKQLMAASVLFIGFQAGAQQLNLNQAIPTDPNVKIGTLPNGLRYYIQKNAKPEKKMELRLVVNAGSILEDADQRGLAHFMEHMNFNGSKHFPKNELVDYLQKVGVQFGADLNAYTSFDETVYMLPIATDDPAVVEKGFTVIEDWAGNNLLDHSEIDKERGVVLEESRLNKGAQARMMKQYFPRLFNGSKYAERLPIGTDSILKTFKYASIENFYKNWYRPNLMAVIVVGDIDPALAEKKIKEHFSGFKNPANPRPRPEITTIKARLKPETMVLTDDEQSNTVLQMISSVTPSKPVLTWGDYRKELIRDIVGELTNMRLQELTTKENPPFVYGFAGEQNLIRGYDANVAFAVIGNNKPKEALDALFAETERVRQFGFLPAELERAKANLLQRAQHEYNERDKSTSSALVGRYIQNFLEKEPIPSAEANLNFIKQVLPNITLAEVNARAKGMPDNSSAFAMLLAPAKKKAELPTNGELMMDLLAANKQKVAAYEEKAISTTLMEKAPAAGKIVKEERNEKLGTINLTLSNGITVTVKPTTFNNDEIVMDAWRKGGWQNFPLSDKENASTAAQIVNEMGVNNFSPTDLEKFMSGKNVSVTPYLNDNTEGIEGNSTVKDVETFFQLINLYFTAPRMDESLFRSMVNKQKGMLAFVKNNPQVYYQDTLQKILYNSNPWIEGIPTPEEMDKLDANKAMAIYKQVFGNADGLHFTFAGNIDMATFRPMLEQYLGSLPARKVEHEAKDNGIRPVSGVVKANIKKGKEPKALVNVIWTGTLDKYDPKDNLAMKALVDVLNIEVIEKLREELGGMYSGGLRGTIEKRPYLHYSIQASIPTGPEAVNKMVDALMAIVNDAQSKGLDQKNLDKVKETWKKQYRTSLQNNNYWVSALSNAWIDNADPELILNYEQRVDALTIDDLKAAAKKFLNMNNYVQTTLYPENADVPAGVQKKSF